MITPKQASKLSRYTDKEPLVIIQDIDKSIKQNHNIQPYEMAILDYEVPWSIRDRIAQRYLKAGWNYVYHDVRPMDETEQKRETVFYLSTTEIKHIHSMCLITKKHSDSKSLSPKRRLAKQTERNQKTYVSYKYKRIRQLKHQPQETDHGCSEHQVQPAYRHNGSIQI